MEFNNEVGRALERACRSGQYLRPVTLYVYLDQVNGFGIDTFGCQPRVEGVAPYPANLPARLGANRIEAAARIVALPHPVRRLQPRTQAASRPWGARPPTPRWPPTVLPPSFRSPPLAPRVGAQTNARRSFRDLPRRRRRGTSAYMPDAPRPRD